MDANVIGPWIKFCGASILIIALISSITAIIALWPEGVPTTNDSTVYQIDWFNVHPLTKPIPTKASSTTDDTVKSKAVNLMVSPVIKPDHKAEKNLPNILPTDNVLTCNFNTLLLIIVALGGFLGNLIHVSRSYADFVGNGDLKKDWIPWYFITPFSASALALGIYFALRAGFFNYSTGSANINPFGIMITAIVTGLFTDSATLKLKEVFDTIFKPKDERSGALNARPVIMHGHALKIAGGNDVKITLDGSNLSKNKLSLFVDNTLITKPIVTDTSIQFIFHVASSVSAIHVKVNDDSANPVFDQDLIVQ